MDEADLWYDLLPTLKNYESMTWADIERDKHRNHSVSVGDIIPVARKRLQALNIENDELFRFRFSGKGRLWGIREAEVFNVIWWDPDHQVCPSKLKRT